MPGVQIRQRSRKPVQQEVRLSRCPSDVFHFVFQQTNHDIVGSQFPVRQQFCDLFRMRSAHFTVLSQQIASWQVNPVQLQFRRFTHRAFSSPGERLGHKQQKPRVSEACKLCRSCLNLRANSRPSNFQSPCSNSVWHDSELTSHSHHLLDRRATCSRGTKP